MREEILGYAWWLVLRLKDAAPIVISLVALFISLRDRRPRLTLRARKGDWCRLRPTLDSSASLFQGIIEVYNVSSRANAIRGYEFSGKRENGDWEKMESELYNNTPHEGEASEIFNQTPLTLAPYSGVEIRVQAFVKGPRPYKMHVRAEVEDLFGKRYWVEVTATA